MITRQSFLFASGALLLSGCGSGAIGALSTVAVDNGLVRAPRYNRRRSGIIFDVPNAEAIFAGTMPKRLDTQAFPLLQQWRLGADGGFQRDSPVADARVAHTGIVPTACDFDPSCASYDPFAGGSDGMGSVGGSQSGDPSSGAQPCVNICPGPVFYDSIRGSGSITHDARGNYYLPNGTGWIYTEDPAHAVHGFTTPSGQVVLYGYQSSDGSWWVVSANDAAQPIPEVQYADRFRQWRRDNNAC